MHLLHTSSYIYNQIDIDKTLCIYIIVLMGCIYHKRYLCLSRKAQPQRRSVVVQGRPIHRHQALRALRARAVVAAWRGPLQDQCVVRNDSIGPL